MPNGELPEFLLASFHARVESVLSIQVYLHPMDFDVSLFFL